ncbi:MAG: 1-hydroxy-2-methyl-2-(E)-butenyl 4-diphosphate synthase [Sphingobacteriaceae bacterium]|nr:MAG: 1-hydroxy-2-methyl-2-(E)-butenyl 4-diphosphate synthase [Sphingobacteriaceae bacterium]
MNADAVKVLPGRYCNSLTEYSRFITREVNIGDVPMGGTNPIRIQSMTTTDTMDTIGTVEQSIRMIEAGCEYIRITAPSIKEAQNLAEIKKQLRMRGYTAPLVADIHFTPNAAEVAARIVEKVRVNPGNYADKKKFDQLDYTDAEYRAELERIFQKFTPLVKVCQEYGTAMRIGTNHGSLSDRIMSRYGDTPQGMVESAMEFIRMCEMLNYQNLVVSMKSSNPQVMVAQGARQKESLTPNPSPAERGFNKEVLPTGEDLGGAANHSPYEYKKRETYETNAFIGGHMVPRVVVDLSHANLKDPSILNDAGYLYSPVLDKYNMAEQSVDFVYFADNLPSFTLPGNLKQLYNYNTWLKLANKTLCHPLFTLQQYIAADANRSSALNLVRIKASDIESDEFAALPFDHSLVFVLETDENHGMADQRSFFFKLNEFGLDVPVIVKRSYSFGSESPEVGKSGSNQKVSPSGGDLEGAEAGTDTTTLLQLFSATDLGALFVDGFGDGVWIDAPGMPVNIITSTAFGILQATRSRISKTEYISCPSCGRTLFDLMVTTQMIRSRTSHLKGLKIGIMGCIVNGPGEMADADYGYVGSGTDKITLYRGKEVVKKNVHADNALDELIGIIRGDGNWIEPA